MRRGPVAGPEHARDGVLDGETQGVGALGGNRHREAATNAAAKSRRGVRICKVENAPPGVRVGRWLSGDPGFGEGAMPRWGVAGTARTLRNAPRVSQSSTDRRPPDAGGCLPGDHVRGTTESPPGRARRSRASSRCRTCRQRCRLWTGRGRGRISWCGRAAARCSNAYAILAFKWREICAHQLGAEVLSDDIASRGQRQAGLGEPPRAHVGDQCSPLS